jgi:hypothetical protein
MIRGSGVITPETRAKIRYYRDSEMAFEWAEKWSEGVMSATFSGWRGPFSTDMIASRKRFHFCKPTSYKKGRRIVVATRYIDISHRASDFDGVF